jgi:hypothetical protein
MNIAACGFPEVEVARKQRLAVGFAGVPHPCVLCKGGNRDLLILGIEVCAAHPFAQNAKGWGTLCLNAIDKNNGAKGRATRPGLWFC